MKKSISFLLCLILLAGLVVVPVYAQEGLSNFQKTQSYSSGLFTDVKTGDWHAENVKASYEYGLVLGIAANRFGVDENLKLSEIVTLAARLHSIYTNGSANFTQGEPWYQVYVDYAVANGIISAGRFENYDAYATRYQVAEVLAAALPASALTAINAFDVGDIPDVSLETNYHSVYLLYRAGVLTGKTAAGAFYPSDNILRSEIAAIVTRMAVPSLRVAFTITPETPGTVGEITNSAGLIAAVDKGRESVLYAKDYFSEAYKAALLGGGSLAQAGLGEAKEYIDWAARYAKDSAAYCKANAAYAGAYERLNTAYLASIEASELIAEIAKAPLASSYTATGEMIAGIGEALGAAMVTIKAVG